MSQYDQQAPYPIGERRLRRQHLHTTDAGMLNGSPGSPPLFTYLPTCYPPKHAVCIHLRRFAIYLMVDHTLTPVQHSRCPTGCPNVGTAYPPTCTMDCCDSMATSSDRMFSSCEARTSRRQDRHERTSLCHVSCLRCTATSVSRTCSLVTACPSTCLASSSSSESFSLPLISRSSKPPKSHACQTLSVQHNPTSDRVDLRSST